MLNRWPIRSRVAWLAGAVFFLFLCYLPVFTAVFGMHNDLSLLFKLPPWPHFIETDHLLVVGRPVGAVLVNFPYHTLNRLEELGWWRLGSFLTMLVFLGVLWFYLEKKWCLPRIWACGIAVATGFLPVWVLAVTWVCHWSAGSLMVALAALTYTLWDSARNQGGVSFSSWVKALAAFLCFEILMFGYPVGVLTVFVFTFGYVVWPVGGLRQCRKVVLTDTIFFGCGILLYRVMERWWVTPWFTSHTAYVALQPEYKMGINLDVFSRLPLIGELVTSSLAGTWHLFFGAWGLLVWLVVVLFCFWFIGSKGGLKERAGYIERAAYLTGLFALVNLPLILAEGVQSVLGYRVLVAGSMMGGIVFWGALYGAFRLASRRGRSVFVSVAAGLVGISGAMVCTHLMDVVKNYRQEEAFVIASVRAWDSDTVRNCVFVKFPPGKTFIQRPMRYEFGLMITDSQHFIPLALRAQYELPPCRNRVVYYVLTPAEAATLPVRKDLVVMDVNQPFLQGME